MKENVLLWVNLMAGATGWGWCARLSRSVTTSKSSRGGTGGNDNDSRSNPPSSSTQPSLNGHRTPSTRTLVNTTSNPGGGRLVTHASPRGVAIGSSGSGSGAIMMTSRQPSSGGFSSSVMLTSIGSNTSANSPTHNISNYNSNTSNAVTTTLLTPSTDQYGRSPSHAVLGNFSANPLRRQTAISTVVSPPVSPKLAPHVDLDTPAVAPVASCASSSSTTSSSSSILPPFSEAAHPASVEAALVVPAPSPSRMSSSSSSTSCTPIVAAAGSASAATEAVGVGSRDNMTASSELMQANSRSRVVSESSPIIASASSNKNFI